MTETELPPAMIGVQFVTDLLQKVDKDQKDEFRSKHLLPYLISLRKSEEALIEVLQGASSASKRLFTVTSLTHGQENQFTSFCGKV